MEKKIKIKKEDCDFDLEKVKGVNRVDVVDDGIEITFEISEK